MADRKTLKSLFLDDPEIMRVIEQREQTDMLRQISEKEIPNISEVLNVLEAREQTALLREIAANKALMKGEKGDIPQRGVDYFTDEEAEEFLSKATPIKGVHYFDGQEGKDGKDGERGIDADEEKVISAVLSKIKPPKDGKSISRAEAKTMISDLLDGLEAKDLGAVTVDEAEAIAKKHVVASNNKLAQDLANLRGDVMRNYGGHGGKSTAALISDLSSQLDGTTKSFTIPANTAITLVTGSSAPFIFRPTVDYTGSGTTTITFTSSVDAPSALASGQTLIVQYY